MGSCIKASLLVLLIAIIDGLDINALTNISRILPSESSLFNTTKLPPTNWLATIGNGYVSHQCEYQIMYVSGVYNGEDSYQTSGSNVSHRAQIHNTNSFDISLSTNIKPTNYSLDINSAIYSTDYKTSTYEVNQIQYAHRLYRNLLITQIFVNNTLNKNGLTISITTRFDVYDDVNFTKVECPNNNYPNYSCSTGYTQKSEGDTELIKVGIMYYDTKNEWKTITVKPGDSAILYFPSVILTSMESQSIETDLVSLFNDLYGNRDEWLTQHITEWSKLWMNGRIDIIDDDEMAANVYSSLYYIYSSIRDDWYHGLSPGSLATDGYLGHVFWDQETWMYPPLLMLHGDSLGYSALQYRRNTLLGAELNGNITGFNGSARYPWESSVTGLATCPAISFETYEIHINCDIALAVREYYYMTANKTWLNDIGYPIVSGISKFWAARSSYYKNTQKYGWCHVTPPDEYHGHVNDSAYTNYGAAQTLLFGIASSKILGKTYPSNWEEIANNTFIPYDNVNKYHPEFDGYTIGTKVKQADVILLGFPWMMNMTAQIFENDLKIYENVTDPNGPAMTWSMFTIGYLKLKEFEYAMEIFKKSYVNIQQPFKIWTEDANGKGTVNFITGAGGFLQSFIFGFGGFRIYDNYLYINYNFLPWKQMNLIGIDYMYNSINFNMYNSSSMDITVINKKENTNNQLIIIYNDNSSTELLINKTVNISPNKQPIKIQLK